MLELEVLVGELLAVDRLAACVDCGGVRCSKRGTRQTNSTFSLPVSSNRVVLRAGGARTGS